MSRLRRRKKLTGGHCLVEYIRINPFDLREQRHVLPCMPGWLEYAYVLNTVPCYHARLLNYDLQRPWHSRDPGITTIHPYIFDGGFIRRALWSLVCGGERIGNWGRLRVAVHGKANLPWNRNECDIWSEWMWFEPVPSLNSNVLKAVRAARGAFVWSTVDTTVLVFYYLSSLQYDLAPLQSYLSLWLPIQSWRKPIATSLVAHKLPPLKPQCLTQQMCEDEERASCSI